LPYSSLVALEKFTVLSQNCRERRLQAGSCQRIKAAQKSHVKWPKFGKEDKTDGGQKRWRGKQKRTVKENRPNLNLFKTTAGAQVASPHSPILRLKKSEN